MAADTVAETPLRAVALVDPRHSRRVAAAAALTLDLLAAVGAYLLALLLHDDLGFLGVTHAQMPVDGAMIVYLAITLGVFGLLGLYQPEAQVSRSIMVWVLVRATAAAFLLTAVTVYLLKSTFVQQSRIVLAVYFVAVLVFSATLRLAWFVPRIRLWTRRLQPATLVVGPSPRMQVLAKRLDGLRAYGNDVVLVPAVGAHAVGVTAVAPQGPVGAPDPTSQSVLALEGALGDATRRGARYCMVFIDGEGLPLQTALALVDAALADRAIVYVTGDLVRALRRTGLLFRLFETPLVRLIHPAQGGHRAAKRALDVVGAAFALVLLSPLLLAVALAVKLSSRGPVLFVQHRVGQNGRTFPCYKFRSMVVAERPEEHEAIHQSMARSFIHAENGVCNYGDAKRPVYKIVGDARVTGVGKWLRRSSLDELPQLWNVLKGDMSLVGPRPPLPYEVAEYKEWHHRRLVAKPGLTGLWQVSGRSRVTFDEMVFQDAIYSYGSCLMRDLSLLLRTGPAAISGRGAA